MLKRRPFEDRGIRGTVLCLVVLAGFLSSGCSSLFVDVKYDRNPALKQNFPARSTPATATNEDEKSLEKKGYINIGRLEIWHPGSDRNTAGVPRLLKEAASVGGEVVHVKEDNASSHRTAMVRGRCLSETSRTVSENVPFQTPRKDSRGNVTGYDTHYRSETRTVKECVQWEQVPKTTDGLVTSGTVWRYDSEAKTGQNEFGGETIVKTYDKGEAGSENIKKVTVFFDANRKKVKSEYLYTDKIAREKGFDRAINHFDGTGKVIRKDLYMGNKFIKTIE